MTTRSLSVAKTGRSSISQGIADLALLYYENPSGKVSALCQESYYADLGEGSYSLIQEWIDITSQESESLPGEFRNAPGPAPEDNSKTLDESLVPGIFTLSAPFASRAENQTQQSGIEASFYSPNASGFEFQYNLYSTGLSGAGDFSQRMHFVFSYVLVKIIKLISNIAGSTTTQNTAIQDYNSIPQSDIAWFGKGYTIWINHTRPVVVVQDFIAPTLETPKPPDNVFPLARLASITLADQSYSYLYHQINGTTFAEEQWDGVLQAWTATEYISISYS